MIAGLREADKAMSRRTQRVGSLIRSIVGEVMLTKLSDPRLDPAKTSITRVEVPDDLLTATVFVSVIGSDADQSKAIHALKHASGHIQEQMVQRLRLRNTPVLTFAPDKVFKKTQETLRLIGEAMSEIHDKQDANSSDQVEQS